MYGAWIFLFVSCGFDDRAGPPDHFMQRRARRHHRIDRIFLLDLEIDQHRAVMLPRRAYGWDHVAALVADDAADAVGLAKLFEIRAEQRSGFVIPLVEELLPLAHHTQIAVVNDGDVHL